jgi:hypothetical protein
MRLELTESGVDIVNIYPGAIDNSFERNALRENDRPGLCPTDSCGNPVTEVAKRIIEAATKPSGEVWLEKEGKWMSIASLVWPQFVDRKLEPLRNRTVAQTSDVKPKEQRKWKQAQIESSIACNLKCIVFLYAGGTARMRSRSP